MKKLMVLMMVLAACSSEEVEKKPEEVGKWALVDPGRYGLTKCEFEIVEGTKGLEMRNPVASEVGTIPVLELGNISRESDGLYFQVYVYNHALPVEIVVYKGKIENGRLVAPEMNIKRLSVSNWKDIVFERR